jgi:hypothetical protein
MPDTEYERWLRRQAEPDSDNAEEEKNYIDGDELIEAKRYAAIAVAAASASGGMKTTRDEFNPSSADGQQGDGDGTSKNNDNNNDEQEEPPPKKRQKIAGPRIVPLLHKTDSDKLATNQIHSKQPVGRRCHIRINRIYSNINRYH